VLVQGQRRDRSGMDEAVTGDGLLPVQPGHAHPVGDHADDAAAVARLGTLHRPGVGGVDDPAVAAHQCATFSTEYFSAASMSPTNSGCGRVGLERSSGWAWVPTKNGCLSCGSSTYSTSEPSGDSPEKTSPASWSADR